MHECILGVAQRVGFFFFFIKYWDQRNRIHGEIELGIQSIDCMSNLYVRGTHKDA